MKRDLRRSFGAPMAIVLAYLALRALFDHLGDDGGLISPAGQPNLRVAALGLVVITLRIIALTLVPAVVAYRGVVLAVHARSTRA